MRHRKILLCKRFYQEPKRWQGSYYKMRKAARTDGNQAAIVDALRKAGASVQILAQCGAGVPDLAVGVTYKPIFGFPQSWNWFLEVKDPSKPKADQKLTPDQEEWHRNWKGQVAVVYTPEDALRVCGLL